MTDDDLLADLNEAERANMHNDVCQVCMALSRMSETARRGTESALAGTIGERRLAEVLTRNGYIVGRRAVNRHRSEGHS